jgi:hypothetical protein
MPFDRDISDPLEEEEEIVEEDTMDQDGDEEEEDDEQATDEEEDEHHADDDGGEEEEHRDAEVVDVSQQQDSDGMAAQNDEDDDEEAAEDAAAGAEQAVEDKGAEDDVADVAVDSSAQAILEISEEKALILFLPAPRDIFPNLNTTWWGKVRHLNWGHISKKRFELKENLSVYPGLSRLVFLIDEENASISNKYYPVARKVTICPMCFLNPVKRLVQCIISCGYNQNKKSINTSNIGAHFRRWHKGQDIPVYQEGITCGEDGDSVGERTAQSHSSQLRQSTMASFAAPSTGGKNAVLNRKAAVAAVKESIYRCVNDLNFPNSTVERPVFREMLYKVKQYAMSLQPTDLQLSNKAIIGLRVDSYNKQVFVLSELV